MSITYAILGFLSWKPLSGYDLKKLFEDSLAFHWSGNNNQIYKSLVDLHKEEMVTLEVHQQTDHPPRKIYTITDRGRSALREWIVSEPELPQLKHSFLAQLAWADLVDADELDSLLEKYEDEMQVHLLMFQEQQKRNVGSPKRTPREIFLWKAISDNRVLFYKHEQVWVRKLRKELADIQAR